MNYRQIETSREIRQWIKLGVQAISVGTGCLIAYHTSPDFKRTMDRTGENIKFWFNRKLNNLQMIQGR